MARTLKPEDQIAHYRIVGPLGAGGMGEVYRAKDQTLEREVALKILPPALVQSEERVRRFVLEAKSASSLSHPHIVTIYEIGHDRVRAGDGAPEPDTSPLHYISMELVSGKTLAAKIHQEKTDLKTLLGWLAQAGEGLAKAHAAGIVHRDLKPGNIMVSQDGYAKVLDFGLAKLTERKASDPDLTTAPTLAVDPTSEGAVLGTVGYMAPEQVQGRAVDHRADIFSFGAILYEVATRQRPFAADSNVETMHRILHDVPAPIEQLNPEAPAELRRLIRRCLAKDPNQRAQSMKDVALELREVVEEYDSLSTSASTAGVGASPAPGVAPRRRRDRIAWALAVTAVATAAVSWFATRRHASDNELVQLSIPAPARAALTGYSSNAAISPDGRMVAFGTEDSAGAFLWVRSFDADSARRLARMGDVGSRSHVPFWSPDGHEIAFYSSTSGKLMKIAVAGGGPVTICDAGPVRGGTWNRSGVIVFAGAVGPLYRVNAAGGDIVPVTALDTTRHETAHRFPQFLPGGEHFLFAALPPGPLGVGVFIGSLKSKHVKKVMSAEAAPIYAEPGYLVFPRQGTIMAQRFDRRRLQVVGEPAPIAGAPPTSNLLAESVASASRNGRLVLLKVRYPDTRLQWFDRTGHAQGAMLLPAGIWYPSRFSADGRRLSANLGGKPWVVDLDRAVPTRLASSELNGGNMVWSPDGSQVAFVSDASGRAEVYLAAPDGTRGPEMLPTTASQFKSVADWSPDGRYLVFGDVSGESGKEALVWLLPMTGDRTPELYLRREIETWRARISPDGRWLAYPSSESGQPEIYVESFPKPGHRVRISTDGGTSPAWTRGGKELVYFDRGRWMSVAVEASEDLRPGVPRTLFAEPQGVGTVTWTKDGGRFLASIESEEFHPEMQVFFNWTRLLKR